jgi:hypothetical protein
MQCLQEHATAAHELVTAHPTTASNGIALAASLSDAKRPCAAVKVRPGRAAKGAWRSNQRSNPDGRMAREAFLLIAAQ